MTLNAAPAGTFLVETPSFAQFVASCRVVQVVTDESHLEAEPQQGRDPRVGRATGLTGTVGQCPTGRGAAPHTEGQRNRDHRVPGSVLQRRLQSAPVAEQVSDHHGPVAHVADPVLVAVGLVRIRLEHAVVRPVLDPVAVSIRVQRPRVGGVQEPVVVVVGVGVAPDPIRVGVDPLGRVSGKASTALRWVSPSRSVSQTSPKSSPSRLA